jgi:hypothetical protein
MKRLLLNFYCLKYKIERRPGHNGNQTKNHFYFFYSQKVVQNRICEDFAKILSANKNWILYVKSK